MSATMYNVNNGRAQQAACDMYDICEALGCAAFAGELDAAGTALAQHLAAMDLLVRCPVSLEEFTTPVSMADGFLYERRF